MMFRRMVPPKVLEYYPRTMPHVQNPDETNGIFDFWGIVCSYKCYSKTASTMVQELMVLYVVVVHVYSDTNTGVHFTRSIVRYVQ